MAEYRALTGLPEEEIDNQALGLMTPTNFHQAVFSLLFAGILCG